MSQSSQSQTTQVATKSLATHSRKHKSDAVAVRDKKSEVIFKPSILSNVKTSFHILVDDLPNVPVKQGTQFGLTKPLVQHFPPDDELDPICPLSFVLKEILASTEGQINKLPVLQSCLKRIVNRSCFVEDLFSDLNAFAHNPTTLKFEVYDNNSKLNHHQMEAALQMVGYKFMNESLSEYQAVHKELNEHTRSYGEMATSVLQTPADQTTSDEMRARILSELRSIVELREKRKASCTKVLSYALIRNARVAGNVVYIPRARSNEIYHMFTEALALDPDSPDTMISDVCDYLDGYLKSQRFGENNERLFGLREYSKPFSTVCWVTVTCTGCPDPANYFKRFFLDSTDAILRFYSWSSGTANSHIYEAFIEVSSTSWPTRKMGWHKLLQNKKADVENDPLNSPDVRQLHSRLQQEMKDNPSDILSDIQMIDDKLAKAFKDLSEWKPPPAADKEGIPDLFGMSCSNYVTWTDGLFREFP